MEGGPFGVGNHELISSHREASWRSSAPLSGLARAFFYAGAHALLVSHCGVASDARMRRQTDYRCGAEGEIRHENGLAEAMRQEPDLPACHGSQSGTI